MGVSVVQLANGETLIDMSDATITEDTVLEGYVGYGADGEPIVGKAASVKKTEINITLAASDWVDNQQTIAVFAVTSGSTVFAGGDSGSEPEYSTCEVYCSAQSEGSLTFSCTYLPMEDVVVNVVIFTSPAKLLYKLPKETIFDGSEGQQIDTGVTLFDVAKDFTIVVDATLVSGYYNCCLLASSRNSDATWAGGLEIKTTYNWHGDSHGFRIGGRPSDGSSYVFSPFYTAERTKVAVVYKQGVPSKFYAQKASDTSITSNDPSYTWDYVQNDGTAYIGGTRTGSELFVGTIHALAIYDAVLTVDEITEKLKF